MLAPASPAFVSKGTITDIIGNSESGNRDYGATGQPVISPKGARYRMQVMPETARDPGFGITPARNDTPAEFNRVGEQYWQTMLNRYGGDPAKMFAAYNWGPGNLDAALAKYGDNWLNFAPAETRNYVAGNLSRLRRR